MVTAVLAALETVAALLAALETVAAAAAASSAVIAAAAMVAVAESGGGVYGCNSLDLLAAGSA